MEPARYSETSVPMRNVITDRKPNIDCQQLEDLRSTWLQWRTQEFCSVGVQQIQSRTEDTENGDLGAVSPSQEFWRQL